MIAIFLLFKINGIKCQITDKKLDQVKLMKQFIGTWKFELGKDTFLISENSPFGTGMTSKSQIITNDAVINSIIQLYGYDKKTDKFVVAELFETSPVIELCNAWFISNKAGEIVIFNPENAALRFRFEFKTPDLIVQTAIIDDKVIKEVKGIKMK